MATKKFRTTVELGKKKYPPGADVPIGTKDGLSADDVARIEATFGAWIPETASDMDTLVSSLRGELDRASEEYAVLAEGVSKLQRQLSDASTTNATLAAEKAALEKQLADRAAELKTATDDSVALAARVNDLEGEVTRLKAAVPNK